MPFRLRVVGTAGSGKTQLALAVLHEAAAAGKSPAYICFNRPLADHMAQLAPSACLVATYHQLCDRAARLRGETPDFSRPGVFQALEESFAAHAPDDRLKSDELIIDEGQDFNQAWVEPLLRLLKPAGRVWWLEDPMQNLYGRPPVSLPGWTVLHADTNYRSPRDVLADLNRLIRLERPIAAGSPLSGSGLELVTYADARDLIEKTKHAIGKAVAAGFKRPMIVVATFRGREKSLLSPYTRLGPYALRTFTGSYDLLGSPVYTEGEVTLDSVYRLKGQSAPAVVFTEIDFETLDELTTRKLFVGATRASMKLICVISERAARVLLDRLQ
jgi:superfamily I DNA and RNA helicase